MVFKNGGIFSSGLTGIMRIYGKGIRNFENITQGLQGIARTLRKGRPGK